MTIFESQKECKRFYEITGKMINPWYYKDNLLIAATGEFVLDIIKMDDALKNRYTSEYPDDMSMSDFLITKWGKEANSIIDRLIS